MKNYMLLFLFALLFGYSCSESNSIEDDLVGEWVYERETFISGVTFEDSDKRGIMIFNKDETGRWLSDSEFNIAENIEWDLQSMDTKIAITKKYPESFMFTETPQLYDLAKNNEDQFTFTYSYKFESFPDSLGGDFEIFENIILVRK